MHLRYLIVDDHVSIAYDATNDWLYVDWRGEHTAATSRAACLLMLEALRKQPCSKILNDNSNISYTTVVLSEWSVAWLATMRAAGLQHLAWVLPRCSGTLDRAYLTLRAVQKPVVVTFADVASAYEWLHKQ